MSDEDSDSRSSSAGLVAAVREVAKDPMEIEDDENFPGPPLTREEKFFLALTPKAKREFLQHPHQVREALLKTAEKEFKQFLRKELKAKRKLEDKLYMEHVWNVQVEKKHDSPGRRRRQNMAEKTAQAMEVRPSTVEYLSQEPSYGVIEVDTNRVIVGSLHPDEAMIQTTVWGFRNKVDAEMYAAIRNSIIYAEGPKSRANKLVAVAVPRLPCTITTLDGSKSFYLPGTLPIASNSLLAAELVAQVGDVLLPAVKKESEALCAKLETDIAALVAKHKPKLSPSLRAAWVDDFASYGMRAFHLFPDRSTEKDVPEEDEFSLPDTALWEKHIAPIVATAFRTLKEKWDLYNMTRYYANDLASQVHHAFMKLPLEMLGPTSASYVAAPGVPCELHRKLMLPENLRKQREPVVETALLLSRKAVEDARERELAKSSKPKKLILVSDDDESGEEKDKEEEKDGELLPDVDFSD